jgi:hypothetical protein
VVAGSTAMLVLAGNLEHRTKEARAQNQDFGNIGRAGRRRPDSVEANSRGAGQQQGKIARWRPRVHAVRPRPHVVLGYGGGRQLGGDLACVLGGGREPAALGVRAGRRRQQPAANSWACWGRGGRQPAATSRECWAADGTFTGEKTLGRFGGIGGRRVQAGRRGLLAVGQLEAEILHLFLPSFDETLPHTATGAAALTPPPQPPDVQLLAMAPPCWPCCRQEGQESVPLLPLSDAHWPTRLLSHRLAPPPAAVSSPRPRTRVTRPSSQSRL